MKTGTRVLSPAQFERSPGLSPQPVLAVAAANPPAVKVEQLAVRLQDTLSLGSNLTDTASKSGGQLNEALQTLKTLTNSGPNASLSSVLQRFKSETLPQNLESLRSAQNQLQAQINTLSADSPERQTLEQQLQVTNGLLELYQQVESLLTQSPVLQTTEVSTATAGAPQPEVGNAASVTAPATEAVTVSATPAAPAEPQTHPIAASGPEATAESALTQGDLKGFFAALDKLDSSAKKIQLLDRLRVTLGEQLLKSSLTDQFQSLKKIAQTYGRPLDQVINQTLAARDATRAAQLVTVGKLEEKLAAYAKVKSLGADALKYDLESQLRLRLLAQDQNVAFVNELSQLLGIEKSAFSGAPKEVSRLVDKLVKEGTTLENIGDVTRARVSFGTLTPDKVNDIRDYIKVLQDRFGADHIKFNDALDPVRDYRGRINITVAVPGAPKFELQLGARQVDTFYETGFKLGTETGAAVKQNFHDVFYKGVDYYLQSPQNEAFLKQIGKGDAAKGKEALTAFRELISKGTDPRTAAATIAKQFTDLGADAPGLLKDYAKAVRSFGGDDIAKGEKIIEETLQRIGGGDVQKGLQTLTELKGNYTGVLTQLTDLYEKGVQLVDVPGVSKELDGLRALQTSGKASAENLSRIAEIEKLLTDVKAGKAVDFHALAGGVVNKLQEVVKVIPEANLPPLFRESLATAAASAPVAQVATRAADVTGLLDKLGKSGALDDKALKLLQELGQKQQLTDDVFRNVLKAVEKTATENPNDLKYLIEVLKSGTPEALETAFKHSEGAEGVLKVINNLLPVLEKYGIKEVGPSLLAKIGKGIAKALPAIGAAASGYDAVRLGSIALRGKDLAGKEYKDPDLRALALLGASLNTADTVLGVLEFTGVGNVDLPVQLGLAVAEVGVDIALDHYNEHPESIPPALRTFAKASALAIAVTNPAGALAVANIYGLDGTIGIANELTRLAGEGAIQGIKFIADAHRQVLEQGIDSLNTGVHGVADLIRNPEKYAQLLGEGAAEFTEEAGRYLLNKASQGAQAAQEVFALLQDIATNPAKYGEQARKLAFDTAILIGSKVAEAADLTIEFVKSAVAKGVTAVDEALTTLGRLGAKGVAATQELVTDLLKRGGEVGRKALAFAADVIQNPGKYGEQALQLAQSLTQSVQHAIAEGGKTALVAAQYLKELPAQAADALQTAISSGLDKAFAAGKVGLETIKYIVSHPQEVASKLGDKGVEILTQTRDFLVARAKDVQGAARQSLELLEKFYTNGKEYFADLGVRTGKALGDFKDTIVDLVKQGVNVGAEIYKEYKDLFRQKLPEILAAFQDLSQAPVDLLVKIANGTGLTEIKDKVAAELSDLAVSGKASAELALRKLDELGSTGLDALQKLAASGKAIAGPALAQLQAAGDKAIGRLKQLALSGGQIAQEALNALKAQGAGAIQALKEVGLQSQQLGGQAIDALKGLGIRAEAAITEIGSKFHAQAAHAIDALKGLGSQAADSIRSLANTYGDLKRQAISALSAMGSSASASLNGLIDDLWHSGASGLNTLLDLSNDVSQVAGRLKQLVKDKIETGYRQSKIDIKWDFWNSEVDLTPLTRAVGELTDMAASAGQQALSKLKQMLRQSLTELGVPDWVLKKVL